MSHYYSPGCAFLLHSDERSHKITELLSAEFGAMPEHLVCCQHQPSLPEGSTIINTCPGCDQRFGTQYPGISTVSLWEVLAKSSAFPFPDYQGREMSIHDACPTRGKAAVHDAVRTLASRMNIKLVEPEKTREQGICCGDSFYGTLPVEDVKKQMTRRAHEMPCDEVLVYCVSCVKAMCIGGKTPRLLVDLLLNAPTDPGDTDPDRWHAQLREFIARH